MESIQAGFHGNPEMMDNMIVTPVMRQALCTVSILFLEN